MKGEGLQESRAHKALCRAQTVGAQGLVRRQVRVLMKSE